MAVRDLLSTLSDSAARVVDAPVRELVEAVLEERGLADATTVNDALARISRLESASEALLPRVEAAEQAVAGGFRRIALPPVPDGHAAEHAVGRRRRLRRARGHQK